MKRIMLWLAVIQISSIAHTQTWDEWFRQKETQKEYLLEQIAALNVYLGYVKEGYSIARDGLRIINDIKQGDFKLHDDKFQSLKRVNPLIKEYAKVGEIISFQIRIIKRIKECMVAIRELNQFTPSELKQCTLVFNNLLTECSRIASELIVIISHGELEMKDNERLKRIDALYLDIQSNYGFCSSFTEETTLMAVQRMREYHDINMSRKLNGLK